MTTKVCTACNTDKALDQFYPAPRYRYGVSAWCIPCDKIKSSERYVKNRDKYAAKKAKWREENPQKVKASHANWYQQNRDKKLAQNAEWSNANKERHNRLKEAWRLTNPAKVNANTAKYRALKAHATPPWLTAIHEAQIQEMYDVAIACATQTGVEHHVDHIHPIQGKGFNGLHVPWNLRVIPAHQNRVKLNNLLPEDAAFTWETEQ